MLTDSIIKCEKITFVKITLFSSEKPVKSREAVSLGGRHTFPSIFTYKLSVVFLKVTDALAHF